MFYRIMRTGLIVNVFLTLALTFSAFAIAHPVGAASTSEPTRVMAMTNVCNQPDKIPAEARRFAAENNIALCRDGRNPKDGGGAQPNNEVPGACGTTSLYLGYSGGLTYFNMAATSTQGVISRVQWSVPFRVDWGATNNSLSGGAWVWSGNWADTTTYGTGPGTIWARLDGWAIVGALGTVCTFNGATDLRTFR